LSFKRALAYLVDSKPCLITFSFFLSLFPFGFREKAVTLLRKPWIPVCFCVVALGRNVVGLAGVVAWEPWDEASFSKRKRQK